MPVQIRKLISRSPTLWVKAWLSVLGPPFIALTVAVSCLGGAIAFQRQGLIQVGLWLLSTLSLSIIHFGTSSLNDYFDYAGGTDNINASPTIFSGGSRVIQEGLLSPAALLIAGSLLIALGSGIGLYLAFLKGWIVLVLGIVGVFLAVGYVHPQVNLSKRGLGELAVGISFGPLMLSGVYFVQTGVIDRQIILIGMLLGLLALAVLWINEIPDYEADKTSGKTNWVVRLGKKTASRIYVGLLALVYLFAAALIWQNILPRLALLCFSTLVFAVKAAKIALTHYDAVEKLLPANALTIAVALSFNMFLTLAFLLR